MTQSLPLYTLHCYGLLFTVLGIGIRYVGQKGVMSNYFGFRTKATLSHVSVWKTANNEAGLILFSEGVIFLIFTFLFPAIMTQNELYAIISMSILALSGILIVHLRANKMAATLLDYPVK